MLVEVDELFPEPRDRGHSDDQDGDKGHHDHVDGSIWNKFWIIFTYFDDHFIKVSDMNTLVDSL